MERRQQVASWEDIPSEITVTILSFVSMKELCVLDQVSSWLHRLSCLDELWRSFVRSSSAILAAEK